MVKIGYLINIKEMETAEKANAKTIVR